ncbi:hypothetical protein LZP85_10800 [Priestia flexa]|jgi:hypothetical protein|uniref:Uncharacterized protein n=2 Tax=Priestia TaxID=2800373 RepID=A0A0V8JQH5_9BACI|nr:MULTISPECIES: hypothetical protein [Priestia]KZB93390.1 hypothetical protein A2U94_00180 [Bacillus sp. VT 712]AQX54531.1 hypothetical protein BC359_09575 [Priestia flexa]KSU89311.1 hypothetical protein AS180_03210 [Priestia veravalensis]MBY6085597.1 hypothetical protein [Priestia flexa]MCG7313663.1 hypothetical protein [Priestia flexa]
MFLMFVYIGGILFFLKVLKDRDFIWLLFLLPFSFFVLFYETSYFNHIPVWGKLVFFTSSFLMMYAMILVYNRFFRKEA